MGQLLIADFSCLGATSDDLQSTQNKQQNGGPTTQNSEKWAKHRSKQEDAFVYNVMMITENLPWHNNK